MTFQIYCRQAKTSKKDGKSPVEIALNDGTTRLFFSTPYRYYPTDFERLRNQKKTNEVKEIINTLERHYFKTIMDMETNNIPLSATAIKECWNGISTTTTRDLAEEFKETLKPRVGNNLCWSQYEKYCRVLVTVANLDKVIENVTAGDIDSIVREWEYIYKPSTLNGYISKLKSVFLFATNKGYIKKNPCFNVKRKKCDETVETITDEQYKSIKAHEFVGRIENIKEILILLAGTGLSYCDLKNFNPDNVKVENGITIYHNKRQKTGQAFYSIILPDALTILRKYDFKPQIPSNQKLNAYLKEIQDICGIDTNITCHKLRHFYTRKLLLMGLPIEVIQKTLGHSQVKMTSHYAHLLQEQNITFVSNAFSQILNK